MPLRYETNTLYVRCPFLQEQLSTILNCLFKAVERI